MRLIEDLALRYFVRKCKRRSFCDARCPFYQGVRMEPCRIGMPWKWALRRKK